MAKTKYQEKGICKNVASSVEKIVKEHILPHHSMSMLGQQFRDDMLWTLEIDDLYKANIDALNQIFKVYQMGGDVKGEFTVDDVLIMMEEIGYFGTDHEKKILKAFALSKNLIIDEMEEFDSYKKLTRGEFYEFIGRAAFLLLTQEENVASDGALLRPNKSPNKQLPSHRSSQDPSPIPYDDGVPLIKKIEKLMQ